MEFFNYEDSDARHGIDNFLIKKFAKKKTFDLDIEGRTEACSYRELSD